MELGVDDGDFGDHGTGRGVESLVEALTKAVEQKCSLVADDFEMIRCRFLRSLVAP